MNESLVIDVSVYKIRYIVVFENEDLLRSLALFLGLLLFKQSF